MVKLATLKILIIKFPYIKYDNCQPQMQNTHVNCFVINYEADKIHNGNLFKFMVFCKKKITKKISSIKSFL